MKKQNTIKMISLLLLSGLLTFAYGQESTTENATQKNPDDGYVAPKTILDHKKVRFSGYGGPTVRFGALNGDFAVFTGGKGGLMINDALVIGGGGSGMVHPLYMGTNNPRAIGYGGFLVEFLLFPKSLVNFSLGTIIGAGGGQDGSTGSMYNKSFFVLEPEVCMFLNITPFFKIGLTGTYRYTAGLKGNYINDASFRGFSGGLVMEFGKF